MLIRAAPGYNGLDDCKLCRRKLPLFDLYWDARRASPWAASNIAQHRPKVLDTLGHPYAVCTMPGCERTASEPPHKHEGQAVCPRHAAQLAGGLCSACSKPLDDSPYRVYPARDGRAVCIDCWAEYG